MNLAIDFGNTRIKAGVFNQHELADTQVFDSASTLLEFVRNKPSINRAVVCSVTAQHQEVISKLEKRFSVLNFNTQTKIPLQLSYKSPQTLGADRLAVALGAVLLSRGKNMLAIDAGTCVKYNLVNFKGQFEGGAISPGIRMKLKAMHHFTHALPDIEPDFEFIQALGRDTRESLLAGALTATARELDGMIEHYRGEFENLQVYITGGDAPYLCKQLKSRFFAHQNLLLNGLNAALLFNLEK